MDISNVHYSLSFIILKQKVLNPLSYLCLLLIAILNLFL